MSEQEMGEKLWSMLQKRRAAVKQRAPIAGPWMVYGAGGMGRKMAAELIKAGFEVLGFVDKMSTGALVDGLPSWTLLQAQSGAMLGCNMAVGIHNPGVDVDSVGLSLRETGCSSVWLSRDLVEFLPKLSHCWLEPAAAMHGLSREKLQSVVDVLSWDAESLGQLGAIMASRWGVGDAGAMRVNAADQYSPKGICPLPKRLRMIDCGAYVGDSYADLLSKGHVFDAYAGLEPDVENFKSLAKRLAGAPGALALPCAAWSGAAMLEFAPDDAAGKIVQGMQGVGIQALGIDESLMGMEPNFIKMDIEGAEAAALEGARQTIALRQPRLAVSSYHSAMDIWNLPIIMRDMLEAGGGKARVALRSHAQSSFDSVLYAWTE